VGETFLTAILTHVEARGVEQQLAYLREVAPASRFVVCHAGDRAEFERLAANGVDAVFLDDPRLRTYGDLSWNTVIAAVHERWVAPRPEVEMFLLLEYDELILRGDFEEALAGLAARADAAFLGKAAGPRDDTNWPHHLRYRDNAEFNDFIARVSRRENTRTRFGCFGPGMVFRRDALDAVAAVIGDAPPVMQELMLPTLVHHLGFRVVDVHEHGDLYAGIRWKPEITVEEALEAKRAGRFFVHPFKRMDRLAAVIAGGP
jgi:hypothetical protein